MSDHCLKDLYEDETVHCDCPVCRGLWPIVSAMLVGLVLLIAGWLMLGCVSGGGTHPPPIPQILTLTVRAVEADVLEHPGIENVTITALDGPAPGKLGQTDGSGTLTVQLAHAGLTICAQIPGYRVPQCQPVPSPGSVTRVFSLQRLDPQAPALDAPLRSAGRIFRTNSGAAFRWKGVSAFKLLDRFAKGEDIRPFLDSYKGFNVLRVWLYVEGAAWGGRDWPTPPSADVTRKFLSFVGWRGWFVELTLLTDDRPARLAWAKAFVPQLTAGGCPVNALLEAGNEPRTHKAIDTAALKPALAASGCLYASGDYEDSARAYGTFGVAHTPRDSEWPRKAHDLLEYFNGGGPHAPSDPSHKYPWVADEPAKPQDVSGDKANDWRAYFGTASLLGAGATFHGETLKYADLPTAEECTLAAAALEGLNAFPADAPLGSYSRPSDASLRTYIVGGWMVRVRPTTDAPSGNWQRLGPSRIFWRKP